MFLSGLSVVSAQTGGDAGDLYFKGYLQFTEAERMEKSGDLQNAYQKLVQAQQNIGSVARTAPSWQPEIVSYRLKIIEQALQRLSGASLPPIPANPSSITASPNISVVVPTGTQSVPTMPMIANPIDIINQQFQALQKQNAEFQAKQKLYEDGYTNATRERQKSEQDRVVLSQQLQDINMRMDRLAKDAAAKITGADQQLQKLQKEARMVSDMLASRDQQLAEKDKTIASLENEKQTLLNRQKQMDANPVVETSPDGQTSKVAKENDMLRNIIMRDLRQRVRESQAMDLVIAELKKTERPSPQIMEHLEEVNNGKK
jgi:phage shock protein A